MKSESLSSNSSAKLRVLIVDDDAFVSAVMADMMSTLGASEVLLSANGKEAMQFFCANKIAPELVLCDLAMPGNDGFQLMEELGKKDFNGGVVLISGQKNHVLHSATLMARFHQLNILDSLEKPVSLLQLQSVIERLRAN